MDEQSNIAWANEEYAEYETLVKQLDAYVEGGVLAKRDAMKAADAIRLLIAKLAESEEQLTEFSIFLNSQTGGLLSKTSYSAAAMIQAADDYQQRICNEDCAITQELHGAIAERNAALYDLRVLRKETGKTCFACERENTFDRCLCVGCEYNNGDNWEWRGVPEERNKEEIQ